MLIGADIIVITDIYAAREKSINGVSGELIFSYASEISQKKIYFIHDKKTLTEFLMKIIIKGDIIITMGAGDIWEVSEDLVQKLRENMLM